MTKIKYIVEAFSMQPDTFMITLKESGWLENELREIKLEKDRVGENEYQSYYVGYTSKGEKLFKYHEKSVNVGYFI